MCALTASNYFTTTGHYHLHVGHTHEDVDAALSLVTIALREESCLLTPSDVMRSLKRKLTPIFGAKGMAFDVELVDTAPWNKLSDTFSIPFASSQTLKWLLLNRYI